MVELIFGDEGRQYVQISLCDFPVMVAFLSFRVMVVQGNKLGGLVVDQDQICLVITI